MHHIKREEMLAHLYGFVTGKQTGCFTLLMYKPPKHQTMMKSKEKKITIITGKLGKPKLLKSQHYRSNPTKNATKVKTTSKQTSANTREKQKP